MKRGELAAQQFGLVRQLLGGAEHLAGRGAGIVGRLADADDVFGDLRSTLGRLLDVAGDLAGGGGLLLDGGGDGAGDRADRPDRLADPVDGRDRVLGGGLDRGRSGC